MAKLEILVYGAEQICASCVGAPSSTETATWLDAALARRYNRDHFHVRYIDIFNPQNDTEVAFSQRVFDEDLWYPVVVVNNTIVSEGTPQLKQVYQTLEGMGLAAL